jgi:hypothetical protein
MVSKRANKLSSLFAYFTNYIMRNIGTELPYKEVLIMGIRGIRWFKKRTMLNELKEEYDEAIDNAKECRDAGLELLANYWDRKALIAMERIAGVLPVQS